MRLSDFLSPDRIILDLNSTEKPDVLHEIANFAHEKGLVPSADDLYKGFAKREEVITTGVGDGVAIPHTRYEGPKELFLIFARSLQGVDFESLDGEPVNLFIIIVGPETADKDQLKILSRTARLLKQADFRTRLLAAKSKEEILEFISSEEALC